MLKHASTLNVSIVKDNPHVKQAYNTLIEHISKCIEDSHKDGKAIVRYELPNIFTDIPENLVTTSEGYTNIKIILYGMLAQEILKHGYKLKLVTEKNNKVTEHVFIISWNTTYDDAELAHFREILSGISVKKE